MDKLSKAQKDEYATAFAILALYDGGAEVKTEQINALLDATNNEVEAFYPIIFSQFCTPEKLAQLIALPAAGGGGGGGGAGGGGGGGDGEEEKKEEEVVEEEEAPAATGMFGDDGGGDY